jgi:hypothetical protein
VASVDIQLEKARSAKSKAVGLFRSIGRVNAVGITRKDGKYAVKVNLESAPNKTPPTDIDGVPVVVHVVGQVRKQ